MSSTEDLASQGSSSPLQSAQSCDKEYKSREHSVSSGDELSEGLSDDYTSDHSLNQSPRTRSSISPQSPQQPNEAPSLAGEAPSSDRKSPSSRPNKYHGPSSTWRGRTAAERQIAASLDQLRARDLSAHLYNFYSLKRGFTEVGNHPGKEQDPGDVLSGFRRPWVSSKIWTAWPMLPEHVPRESDANPWGAEANRETVLRQKPTLSHAVLQELLAAQACKKAKEKFNERAWEDSDVESPITPSDPWLKKQAEILEMTEGSGIVEEDEPLVMADDERAKNILQPSLNHILRKLDALLMGLHHARNSYAAQSQSSVKSQAKTDDESSIGNKRKRKASHSGTSQERNGRRGISTDMSEDLSATASQPKVTRGRRSQSKRGSTNSSSRSRSRLDRMGLRDWSDVLGVASMCGWDAETVGRAAARCSNLFDEGLVLRTLHEGQDGYQDVNYLPETVAGGVLRSSVPMLEHTQSYAANPPNGDSDSDRGSREQDQDSKVGGVHVDGFLQPIPKHRSWTRQRKGRRKK